MSKSSKFGWFMASQKMAGTEVSTLMRSSSTACRKDWTSNAGMITVVPPIWVVMTSWLLHPVTWNSGTDTRLRTAWPSRKPITRLQVSEFDRKFSCVVMAPFGNPVVPLV